MEGLWRASWRRDHMETNKHAGRRSPAAAQDLVLREAHGQRRRQRLRRAAWSQQQPNVSSEHFICAETAGSYCQQWREEGAGGAEETPGQAGEPARGGAPARAAPSRGRRAEGIGEQGPERAPHTPTLREREVLPFAGWPVPRLGLPQPAPARSSGHGRLRARLESTGTSSYHK